MSLITRPAIAAATKPMEEYVDVYDQAGQPCGYVKNSRQLTENELILTVHIYLYDPKRGLLLQQRALTKKEMPGIWCVTGGKVRAGEPSEQAAVREVREELGLDISAAPRIWLGRCVNNGYLVDAYAFQLIDLRKLRLKADEVKTVKWYTVAEAVKHLNGMSQNQERYRQTIVADLETKLKAVV